MKLRSGTATWGKPLLGHIIQQLKGGYTEAALHVAVRDYAASDWHRERKAWMLPGRFFKDDDVVTKWFRKSREWERCVADHCRAQLRTANGAATVRERSLSRAATACPLRREALSRVRERTPPHRTANGTATLSERSQSPVSLSDGDHRAEYRTVLADRQAHERGHAHWAQRSTDRRRKKERQREAEDAYRRLAGQMPELIAEMGRNLREHPLWREFVLRRKDDGFTSRSPVLSYYYQDHAELDAKVRLLKDRGFVDDITLTNTPRYRMAEGFVELLLKGT